MLLFSIEYKEDELPYGQNLSPGSLVLRNSYFCIVKRILWNKTQKTVKIIYETVDCAASQKESLPIYTAGPGHS